MRQYIAIPPFTSKVEPVMYDASSDATKATTFATSSGRPARRMGTKVRSHSSRRAESV
jgi:hypothetical protein